MIRRRGLVTAASAAGVALAVLGAAAVVMRDRILEAWYARRFESNHPAEKDRAADALASLGSPLAAKYLYQKIRSQLDFSVRPSADPVQMLNRWSSCTGVELTLDPSVDPGSIHLESLSGEPLPAVEALRNILAATGLGYRLSRSGTIVLCPRRKTRDTFLTLPPEMENP